MTLREYVTFKKIADGEQEEQLVYADNVDL
jgi:hypothetical protein